MTDTEEPAECDCCQRLAILTRTWACGMETWACEHCREGLDHVEPERAHLRH
jgi:hypothetical protein